jgi:tetratricopeptide (TPR) repeat protein
MAKRLNKNLVAALSMTGFVVLIVLSILMIKQLEQRDPQQYVEQAARFQNEGDWVRAIMFYNKAYTISSDPKYLVLQGQMALSAGDIGGALKAWQSAITMNKELIEAHESQLDLLLKLARMGGQILDWERVAKAGEALLEVEGGHAMAHNALGLALINLKTLEEGNEARGFEMLRRATELAPERLNYSLDVSDHYLSRAEEALQRGEDGEETRELVVSSDQIITDLLKRFPSSGAEGSKVRLHYALRLARPAYLELLGKEPGTDEAESYFLSAIELAGEDAEALVEAKVAYAQFLTQQWRKEGLAEGRFDLAHPLAVKTVSLLKECIAARPESFDPYIVLGAVYQAGEAFEEAVEVCRARLVTGPVRRGLEAQREVVGTFRLMLLASECCTALAVASESPEEQDTWFDQAEQHVVDALGEIPDQPRALARSGRLKLARGQLRAALEDLRRASEAFRSTGQPDWGTTMSLARLHLRLREPGAARKVLEQVLPMMERRGATDADLWLLYATVLYQNNDYDGVVVATARALQAAPDNQEARRLRVLAFAQLDQKDRVISETRKLTDDRLTELMITVEWCRKDGDVDCMIESLEEALEIEPANLPALNMIVQLLLSNDQAVRAQELVERALRVRPDDTQLKGMLVTTRQDLSPEERQAEFRKIAEAEKDPYDRALGLIALHYNANELREALALLNEAERLIITEGSESARAAGKAGHRALLTKKMLVAGRLDDQQQLREAVDSAETYNVDGAHGKTFLGEYHMYREEGELAITAFDEALQYQPTDTKTLAYLGRCYQSTGALSDAREAFNRAIEFNPNEGLAHRGLAQLASATGDKEAYEASLARCERLLPQDPWVKEEVRARAERADPAAAIARREAELEAQPDDERNLKRLARLCEEAGEFAKGEKYYQRLLELNPEDDNLILATATFLHRAGEPDKALKLLKDHAASQPNLDERANAMIAVAFHYYRLGDMAQMERTLLEAADLAETFEVTRSLADYYMHDQVDRPQQALPWFDKAVARARLTKSPRLAQTLSMRIGCLLHRAVSDIDGAERRIKEFRESFPQDIRGLYWLSELSARMGQISAAIKALDQYLIAVPNDAYALFQRAQHHISTGHAERAMADLERLREEHPAALNLQPRILLARLYGAAGKREKGIAELESLVKLFPGSERALRELVNTYIEEKRYGDAERVVTSLINSNEGQPNPLWHRLRARVFMQLREPRRAVADYQRVVELRGYDPAAVISLLDAYRRSKLFEEGVAYFEAHRAQIPQDKARVVAVYATLLAGMGRENEAVDQLRKAMSLALHRLSAASTGVDLRVQQAFPGPKALELFCTESSDPSLQRADDRICVAVQLREGRTVDTPARLERLVAGAATDQERAQHLALRGLLYQKSGDAEQARVAYEEAVKYNAQDPVSLNNLAYLLSDELDNPQLALPYARQAALLSERAPVLDTLGWIYVKLGQCQEGVAELTRAVQADDFLCVARHHLGEAYRQCGDFETAGNVLRAAAQCARRAGDTELFEQINASMERVEAGADAP